MPSPSTWIIQVWDTVPKGFVPRSGLHVGYKTKKQVGGDSDNGLVPYTDQKVRDLMYRMCGNGAYVNFQDEADVGPNQMFPKYDNT